MTKPYSRISRSGQWFFQKNWDTSGIIGTSTQAYAWEERADGESCPNWRDRIASLQSATTPFTANQVTVVHTDGTLAFDGYVTALGDTFASRRISGMSGCLKFQNYSTQTPANGTLIHKAESMASSKFYNEAQSTIKALEGGELLGETHKTAKEIVRLTSAVVGGLFDWRRTLNLLRSSHKKGNREASFKRLMRVSSDAYLAWKFGADPLIKDVNALAHDLKNDFIEKSVIEVKGKASAPGPINGTSSVVSPIGALVSARADVTQIEEVSIKYEACLVLQRYGNEGFVERLGLSPSNFAPTLYNLFPWTWLLDYVTNVGDIVSAIAFDPGKVAWSNKTLRRTLKTTVTAGLYPEVSFGLTPHAGYPIASPSTTVWTTKTIARQNAMPDRIPDFRFRCPDFQSEGGRSKWMNIAAVLASQTFGGSVLKSMGLTSSD